MADEKKPEAKAPAKAEAPAAPAKPAAKARVVSEHDRAKDGETRFKLRATNRAGAPHLYLCAPAGPDAEAAAKAAYLAETKLGETETDADKVKFAATQLPD